MTNGNAGAKTPLALSEVERAILLFLKEEYLAAMEELARRERDLRKYVQTLLSRRGLDSRGVEIQMEPLEILTPTSQREDK